MHHLSDVSLATNPLLEKEILFYLSKLKTARFIGDVGAAVFIKKAKPKGLDPYFALDCFLRAMVAWKLQHEPEPLIKLAWNAYCEFSPVPTEKDAFFSFLSGFNRFYCCEFLPCMFFMIREGKVIGYAFGQKPLLEALKRSHFDNPLIYKPNAFLVCDQTPKLSKAMERISCLQARYRELRVAQFERAANDIRKYAAKGNHRVFAIIGKGSTYREDSLLSRLSDLDVCIVSDGDFDLKALSRDVLEPLGAKHALFFSPRLLSIFSVKDALVKGDVPGIASRLVGSYLFVSDSFIPLIRRAESIVPGLAWDKKQHVLRYSGAK